VKVVHLEAQKSWEDRKEERVNSDHGGEAKGKCKELSLGRANVTPGGNKEGETKNQGGFGDKGISSGERGKRPTC